MCFSCQPLRRMLTLFVALALAALVLLSHAAAQAQAPADWKTVKVPEVWKTPPAGVDGLSWYRGFLSTPGGWKGKDLELFVEPTDAACEVYFNGKKIGGPTRLQSGDQILLCNKRLTFHVVEAAHESAVAG